MCLLYVVKVQLIVWGWDNGHLVKIGPFFFS